MIPFADNQLGYLDRLELEAEEAWAHMVWLDRQREKWSLEAQGEYEAGLGAEAVEWARWP
jgi:hypothetical protein